MKWRNIFWRSIIVISIVFNILTILDLSNQPSYRIGRLREDTPITSEENGSVVLFTIPKGSKVMDVSLRGLRELGAHNPRRFSIVVKNFTDTVDYTSSLLEWESAMYQVYE